MTTSTLIYILLTPILFFLLWTLSSTSPQNPFPFTRAFPLLTNKRICLLIAHPDDEAMFFSPTLLALTDPDLGNHVKILCLSTGNADGLGETRSKELEASALRLGLRATSDVFILDDPSRFPDSMSQTWAADAIAGLLAEAFTSQKVTNKAAANGGKRNAKSVTTAVDGQEKPSATIDVLITFDKGGVSGHPNHRSLYHGARAFVERLMKGKSGWQCPVTLYTLTSTPLVRKYVGVLDAPVSMIIGIVEGFLGGRGKKRSGQEGGRLLYVNGVMEYWRARGAMVQAHKSQMVWFRWGWITLGRYMVVNDLKREPVSA